MSKTISRKMLSKLLEIESVVNTFLFSVFKRNIKIFFPEIVFNKC